MADWIYIIPLAGYILLIVFLLYLILPQISIAASSNSTARSFLLVTFLSLLTTWTYMLRYFSWSYINSGASNVSGWLKDTSLFKEAWLTVLNGQKEWWISQQLCYFTVAPLTLFMCVESQKRNLARSWVYMLLGQMVAVSFAQGLFLAVIFSHPVHGIKSTPTKRAHAVFNSACIIGAIAFVYQTPASVPDSFLPPLLCMHVLLFPPLVLHAILPTIEYRLFNLFVAMFTATQHWQSTTGAAGIGHWYQPLELIRLLKQQWNVAQSHPALQSISWDVIMTTLGFLLHIWNKQNISATSKIFLTLSTFMISIPASSSLYLFMST